ncbi:hypothetical protein KSP35_20190 [Aquihabitans sp. G128]|uniref:hypothetical protein n=1 Tax=Aquihabitans sp. G128 TaxID=2849779 RepID=UPI001C244D54|nr:hypothetical protein [Aquihabitans sp. G128]QXC60615.1 hypothetical protein KSP35_20190 [Aquihabitans sp. G128]
MTDLPRPFPRLTHGERLKETAAFYRGRGVPVSAGQVERALELTEEWRAVADARGVSDDDLAGVANLDDEALDAILASDRRIAHETRERHMADELDLGDDLPGLC